MGHTPILLEETMRELGLKKNSLVVDATVDGGGHTRTILKNLGPRGRLVGLDWDQEMIHRIKQELKEEPRAKFLHSNFSNLEKVARSLKIRPDAILFDLGLSSLQLFSSGRGFSFQRDEPLLMTFDSETRPTAFEFLARVSEKELEEIIQAYGEEPFSRRIARAIVSARARRQIRTTEELAEIISKTRPRTGHLHPATKTFQALRIYLNQELNNLESGLGGAWKILKRGGRIAVISYHSLEDRIVKNFFKDKSIKGQGIILTKKPIIPSRKETLENPRARSAKLRAIEKK